MSDNSTATVLGTIGTVLWCIQLLPQIYQNYRRKSTDGLPTSMMLLWAAAGVFFGMYFIAQSSNTALQVQPQIFTALCLFTWCQCLYYAHRFPVWKAAVAYLAAAAVCAGLQVAAAVPIRDSDLYKSNPSPYCWPILMIGVFAALCLIGGLIPPYFELAKQHGRVVGLSLIFLCIDSSGAIFSFASLWFPQTKADGEEEDRDYLGMVLYLIVPAMEFGIVLSHFTWWFRYGRHGLYNDDQESVEEKEKELELSSQSSLSRIESRTTARSSTDAADSV
ncbi:PQ loop repeat-domain-containing protein [Myxozyma melibiosi]|uniref:PQ loop repeat-domain-containing protein n=1 Tax=Myxozyma melibiosi TaxID=54550 RepID=A0ABR1EZD0_9ASCO